VVADESPVGHLGVLTVGTRGASGPGEALVRIRGGSEAFIAWSDDPLPAGRTVLVIDTRGALAVQVVAWLDPSEHH
jgi:predicted nucleotidyltransferase